GGVRRRDRQVVGAAQLLGDRQHPLDEALQVRAGGSHLTGGEVDQLAGKAVADRAPEVLLDQPMLELHQRLSLVDRARDAGGESALSASSSGRKLRRPLQTATARSGPLIATCTCRPKLLLRQTT